MNRLLDISCNPVVRGCSKRLGRHPDYLVSHLLALTCLLLLALAGCGGGGEDTPAGATAASGTASGSDSSRVSTLAVDAAGSSATQWTVCASEGQTCAFSGQKVVRYGSGATVALLTLSDGTPCTNAVFGDPTQGVAKTCAYADVTPAGNFDASSWTLCATENGTCTVDGTRQVRYGTTTQAVVLQATGGTACSNAVFGDPAFGIVKSCWVAGAASDTVQGAVGSLTVPALTTASIGAPVQLAATVDPASTVVVWTVADASIASIGATGLVTPLRAGYTTVTATAGGQSATGALTVQGATPIPTRSQYVGTNVGGIDYYGSNFPFADLMKTSGGWGTPDGSAFPSTAADGTPTALRAGQKAWTPVAWDNSHYPAGRYTVLWDGDGSLSFPMSNVKIVESAAHRIVLEPVGTQQMWVQIDTTNPADPIRNVHFLLPGTESTYANQPFNPEYLRKVAPFSTLRFMDWGATNGSSIVEWADRASAGQAAYTGSKGVPIEAMIELANSLHVDPWFCIPHQASDDYVRQFATLLHDRLDPTLRPHIEYSNEVWNSGFAQFAWASQQSDAQGLQKPSGLPSQFYAKRAVQIFKLMQSVYGSTDAHRLVRVLAGQAAWTQFLQDALAYADTATNIDAIAIAPYFNAESADNASNVDATLRLSASQVIDQMYASVRGPIKSWMTASAALAAQYHVKLEAYESGPTDATWYFAQDKQDPMLSLFTAANHDARMKDLYLEYYAQWKAVGGDTMLQYVDVNAYSKWGLWGALEYTFQDASTSPKYQGLLGFIAANPLSTQQSTLGAANGN